MKFCSKCGSRVNDLEKYCPTCGNTIENISQKTDELVHPNYSIYEKKAIDILLNKINIAKIWSTVGFIVSIVSPIILRIITIIWLEDDSDNSIDITFAVFYLAFTILNILSCVLFIKERKILSYLETIIKTTPENKMEIHKNLLSLTPVWLNTILVLDIIFSLLELPLLLLLIFPIIAIFFIKNTKKFGVSLDLYKNT